MLDNESNVLVKAVGNGRYESEATLITRRLVCGYVGRTAEKQRRNIGGTPSPWTLTLHHPSADDEVSTRVAFVCVRG